MTQVIITQTQEIVNFAHIIQVTSLSLEYAGQTVYALVAQPIGVSEITDETLDSCIQLCIYDSEIKLTHVFVDFKKWLENSIQPVFEFPSDLEE